MTVQHLPGDFQLCSMGGQTGRIIRALQWLNGDGFHDYEHARLCIGTTALVNGKATKAAPGNGWFVEAMPDGAVLAEHPLDGDGLFWSSGLIPLTPAQRTAIVHAALGYAYAHIGYSYLDYASLAARRLHIPAPHLRAYIASTGHMICSQLVARCYLDGGAPLFDCWTGDVTPGDLYELLEARRG